jgi:hypothetical protein
MRVFSPDMNNAHQALIYNFGGLVGLASHIDIAGYVLFGIPTAWTWMETPMYTHETAIGYPQFVFKANTTGSVYLDEVQVIEAAPGLISAARGPVHLKYSYGDFDQSLDTAGWGRENLPNPVNTYFVNQGKLYIDFTNATTNLVKGVKWTATNMNPGVYTPATQVGRDVGLQMDVSKFSGNFNSYSSYISMSLFGVQSSGQMGIAQPGSDLIASAEFGRITNGMHYTAGPSISPYHQFQFIARNDSTGVITIDNIDVLRDNDDPDYGDPGLYP